MSKRIMRGVAVPSGPGSHTFPIWLSGALAAGLLLLSTLLTTPRPACAADGPFFIHGTEVNLRESPNGPVVLVFELNDKVFVIKRDGDWSYVSAPAYEQKGWCWSAYIGEGRKAVSDPPPPADAGAKSASEVTSGGQEAGTAPDDSPGPVADAPVAAAAPLPVEEAPRATEMREGTRIEDVLLVDQDTEAADSLEIRSFGAEPPAPPAPALPPLEPITVAQAKSALIADPLEMIEVDPAPVPGLDYQPAQGGPAPPPPPPGQVTTPDMLAGADKCYEPVGGLDIALISGTNVNVRTDPALKSQVIGKVDTGDKVYIMCANDPWYFVSIPAKQLKGWVFGEYVDQLGRVEITGTQVRLRETPELSARIKTELEPGEVFYEFQRKDGWVLVASSSSGLKGWVHGDYVKATTRSTSRPYVIKGEGINFRTSPNVDSEIIACLNSGVAVNVLGRNEKWSFVEYTGKQGWIYSTYLDPNFKNAPQEVYGKSIGARLIARARAMEGTPYVWGGESAGGVDCSGLIYKLLLDEGADASSLPRRASTQMAGLGYAVDKEDLEPGDLVFFTTYKAGASHVGIYLGDGNFIHASSAQSKVTISNLSEGYYKKRFVGARRITEDELKRLQ